MALRLWRIFATARRRRPSREVAQVRHRLRLERLEERRVLSVTAAVAGGVLTVTANAADNIAITSSAGNVQVNGANPGTGAAAADSISTISITCSGSFANTIDLTGVASSVFTALTTVTADGGPGADVYDANLTSLGSTVSVSLADSGTAGADTFHLNAGDADFTATYQGFNSFRYQSPGDALFQVSSASTAALSTAFTNVAANGVTLAVDSPTTGTAHTTQFGLQGGNFVATDVGNSATILQIPAADIGPVTVTGSTDSQSVIVDLTNGEPLANGLTYHGGGGASSNSLTLQNGTVTNDNYASTSATAGSVSLDGTSLSFTGLSGGITDGLTAANRKFTYTGSAGTVTLTAATAGSMALTSATLGPMDTFTDPTTLDVEASTVAGENNTVTVNSLDAAFAGNLDINSSARVTPNSDIVTVNSLSGNALTSTDLAGSSINLDAAVSTTGNQVYAGPVTLSGAALRLQATGTGNITFSGAVTGTGTPTALTVDASAGTATFGGTVSTQSLNVTGATDLNTASVTTTLGQTYAGAVTLGTNVVLTDPVAITFQGTVDSDATATERTLQTGGGTTTFDAAVGKTAPLASLTVTGPADLNGPSIATNLGQIYSGAVTLTSNSVLTDPVAITFESTINSDATPRTLQTGAGTTTFDAAVGGNAPLASLAVTGPAELDGPNITTKLGQTYSGAVTLGSGVVLNDPVSVSFNSTVNSDATVSPRSLQTGAGVTTFDGAVGNIAALASLSVTGAADLNGPSITTNVGQTYTGAVTLSSNVVLSDPVSITFQSTINSDSTATPRSLQSGLGLTTFDAAVGANAPLASLTVTGPADLNGPTVTTNLGQSYTGAVTLSNDVVLADPVAITFQNTVNSDAVGTPRTLKTGAGTTTFDGAVGSLAPLVSLQVTGAADLNGPSIITNDGQTYSGAVTLTANVVLTDPLSITFQSTVNSDAVATPRSLQTGAGVTTFDAAVGNSAPLASLNVTGAADLNGPSVTTKLGQTYAGAVTLASNVVLTDPLAITFQSTVNSDAAATPRTLQTGAGTTTFDAAVGGNAPLASLSVTGPIDLGASSVITNLGQTYNGAVTLTANVVLTDPVAITFQSTVNSDAIATPRSLQTGAGTTTFAAAVGAGAPLASLAVTGAADLDGPSVTTNLGQSYTGAVTLKSNVVLTDPVAVTLKSTVDSDAVATPRTLQSGPGTTALDGAVGKNAPLASLAVTGPADLNGPSVTTNLGQTYDGAVVLTANVALTDPVFITFKSTVDADGTARTLQTGVGTTTFDGSVGANAPLAKLTVTGPADLNGASVATNLGQTYTGAVTLGSNVVLTDPVAITFQSTVDSDSSATPRTLQTGVGTTTFDGAVGKTAALASLSVTGAADLNGPSVATNLGQSYSGAVTLTSNVVLTDPVSVTFKSTVDSDATPRTLETGGGTTTFDGAVGKNARLASLNVAGPAELNGPGITTNLGQTYAGAVTLSNDVVLTDPVAITFQSTVDSDAAKTPRTLQTGAGTTTFDAAVGGKAPLASLSVTGAADLNGPSISTDGGQAYAGAVTLTSNVVLTDPAFVTFQSTVDSDATARTLQTGAGTTTFDAAVGKNAPLASLKVTGPADLSGPSITTNLGQTYIGPVTLSGNVVVTDPVAINFNSTVNSDATASPRSLQTGAGVTTFDGAVGNTAALASLSVTGAGDLNGPSITTNLGQTYAGPATLTSNAVLTDPVAITFKSTVDSDATASPRSLKTGAGTTAFDAVVGGAVPLASLIVTGAADLNGPSITTGSGQTYTGAVTLTSNVVLTDPALVTFQSTVDSDGTARTLQTGAGTTTFDGAVGKNAPLASLKVTGPADLDGPSVTTKTGQTYASAVRLGSNVVLADPVSITFKNTVDSDAVATPRSLQTGAGTTTFDGPVGGAAPLASLSVTGPADLNGPSITTTLGQTYSGAVTLTSNVVLTDPLAITLQSSVDSDAAATPRGLQAGPGLATFAGAVGKNAALAMLTVTGPADLNGPSIKTSLGQSYAGAVTLTTDVTLTDPVAIAFESTVDADATANQRTLQIGAGTTTFDAAVGKHAALASLNSSGPTILGSSGLPAMSITTTGTQTYQAAVTLDSSTTLNGTLVTFDGAVGTQVAAVSLTVNAATVLAAGSITTSGAQTYEGPLTFAVTPILLTSTAGGAITFDSTVDGPADVTVFTAGTVAFQGNVGMSSPLNSLTISDPLGAASLAGNVTTSGAQFYDNGVSLTSGATQTLTSQGSTSTGNITFQQTVTGSGVTLIVVAPGTATFGGAIANSANLPTSTLASLVTSATPSIGGVFTPSVTGTTLLAENITTTGSQTYYDAVVLRGNGQTPIDLDPTGASDESSSPFVVEPFDALQIIDALNLHGSQRVAAAPSLAALDFNHDGWLTPADALWVIDQLNRGGLTAAAEPVSRPLVVPLAGAAAGITFKETLNGSMPLVTTGGTTEFDGAVGGTSPLVSLTVTGRALLAGGAVTTTGPQVYEGAVTLAHDTTLTATSLPGPSSVAFAATVDSNTTARALTVDAASTTFDAPVGGQAGGPALASLSTSAATTIGSNLLSAESVTTVGPQTFGGPVTLASAATVFTATATDGTAKIDFEGTVSGATALAVAAPGLVTFGGDLGSLAAPLTSLTVTTETALDLQHNISTVGNISATVADNNGLSGHDIAVHDFPETIQNAPTLLPTTLSSQSGSISLQAGDNLTIGTRNSTADVPELKVAASASLTLTGAFQQRANPAQLPFASAIAVNATLVGSATDISGGPELNAATASDQVLLSNLVGIKTPVVSVSTENGAANQLIVDDGDDPAGSTFTYSPGAAAAPTPNKITVSNAPANFQILFGATAGGEFNAVDAQGNPAGVQLLGSQTLAATDKYFVLNTLAGSSLAVQGQGGPIDVTTEATAQASNLTTLQGSNANDVFVVSSIPAAAGTNQPSPAGVIGTIAGPLLVAGTATPGTPILGTVDQYTLTRTTVAQASGVVPAAAAIAAPASIDESNTLILGDEGNTTGTNYGVSLSQAGGTGTFVLSTGSTAGTAPPAPTMIRFENINNFQLYAGTRPAQLNGLVIAQPAGPAQLPHKMLIDLGSSPPFSSTAAGNAVAVYAAANSANPTIAAVNGKKVPENTLIVGTNAVDPIQVEHAETLYLQGVAPAGPASQASLLVNDSAIRSVLYGLGEDDWLLGGSGLNVILGGGGNTNIFGGTSPGTIGGPQAGTGYLLPEYISSPTGSDNLIPAPGLNPNTVSIVYGGSSPKAPGQPLSATSSSYSAVALNADQVQNILAQVFAPAAAVDVLTWLFGDTLGSAEPIVSAAAAAIPPRPPYSQF